MPPAHAKACLPAHNSDSTSESPPHTSPAFRSPPGIPAASSTEYPPPSPSDPAPNPPPRSTPAPPLSHGYGKSCKRTHHRKRDPKKCCNSPPHPETTSAVHALRTAAYRTETPPSCPLAKTSPEPFLRPRASTNPQFQQLSLQT